MIDPTTPRQPKTIPRTVGGIHVKRETTRSRPGARHSHAPSLVPAAPSRGIKWRSPAKPAMLTRVDAPMSSSGIILARLASYGFQSPPPKYRWANEPSREPTVGPPGVRRHALAQSEQ